MEYKEVKQCIQSFIYGVNTPSRWGTQAPFSNITLDWTVPKDLSEEYAIIGGKKVDFKYKDCQNEMDIINKAFIEVMLEGDANGRGFQYPIPTYNVTEDFVWNSENAKLLFDMTSKYGTPYFQNFIKSDLNPGDVRSMCCRLQLDKRELKKKTGGLFGSGEKTGSIGVVTINLPRISFTSENEEEFFERLSYIMNIAKRSLEIKRKVITKFMDDGLYPYAKRYLNNFNTHFSTIGLIGLNECSLNASWIKSSLISERGRLFGEKVLEFMREKIADFQEETGNLYNLEATPAESTSYRLAKMDKEKYQEIVLASKNGESPFYTNSCHLPVNYTDDIFDALEIQEKLQSKFTGGTVFHGFLGEKIKDWETCSKLVKTIASNFRVPYFTISPTYSICKTHGYLEGEQFVCPHCSEEAEVYSRITGYYRPIKNWNDGKQSEYLMRKEYTKYSEDSEDNKNSEIIYKYLFTTETCPKCPEAKNLLKNEENITFINASDNIEHALKYDIRSVPSLVIVDNNKHKVYSGLTEIYKFLSM
jgi:anaerobic ribonucleoside-triphosphate reductase